MSAASRGHQVKLASIDATMIFTPCHLRRLGIEVGAGDMMVRSNLALQDKPNTVDAAETAETTYPS